MPKKEVEEFVEQAIPEQSTRQPMRNLRVRVVYLGSKRNESVALGGSIEVQHFEDPAGEVVRKDRESGEERRYVQQRRAVDGGIQSYDFATHDIKGNLIRERLMPSDERVPERLRGKRFEWVEHPGHIAEFHLGPKDRDGKRRKGDFEVLAKPEDMVYIQNVIALVQKRERRQAADLKEVLTAS